VGAAAATSTCSSFAESCGWLLSWAHAKSGDGTTISGYLGKGDAFDQAMARFALAYADQMALDQAALAAAVRSGRVEARQARPRPLQWCNSPGTPTPA
jgi:hypothetical protein